METPAFLLRVCPQLDKKDVQWLWVLTPLCPRLVVEPITDELRAVAVDDVAVKTIVVRSAYSNSFGSLFEFRGRFKNVLRAKLPLLTVTTNSRLQPASLFYEGSPDLYAVVSPSHNAWRFSVR